MLTMLVLSFAAASQVFTFSAVIGVYKVANPLLLMVIAVSMVRLQVHVILQLGKLLNTIKTPDLFALKNCLDAR